MKWDILPRSHKELKKFQEKYGYNRNQIRRKFNERMAEIGGLSNNQPEIDRSSIKFDIPATQEMLATIKQQDSFRHMTAIFTEEKIMNVMNRSDIWDRLREEIIESLKTSLSGVKRVSQWILRAKDYSMKKTSTIIGMSREYAPLDDTAYDFMALLQSLMYPFVILIEKYATTMRDSTIAEIIKSTADIDSDIFPKQQLQLEKLYYIAGWMLRAAEMEAQRRNEDSTIHKHLVTLVEYGEVSSQDELVELPVGEVVRTDAFGGLKYPNQMFFSFVAMIENACRTCLTANNTIIHGPYIAEELRLGLIDNHNVRSLLRDCCMIDTDEEVSGISEYLVRTYVRMRGKDFVRRLMSSSRRSRSTQHRHEQAALSNPKLRINKRKKKSKKPDSVTQQDDEVTDHDIEILETQSRILHSIVVDIVNTEESEDESTDDDEEKEDDDSI
jgi:hypothetical protein